MKFRNRQQRAAVMAQLREQGLVTYQRRNRTFHSHANKKSVSTAKVKTSKKMITGNRSTHYIKYNFNPNPQQRAMFAAIKAQEDAIIKNKMTEIKLREIEEAKITPISDAERRHLKQHQQGLKTMDDVYKHMLENDYRIMNKPVPLEGSDQYIKDYLNEKQEYTDRALLLDYDNAVKAGDFHKAGRIGREWTKLVEKKHGKNVDKFIKDAGSPEELSRRSMEINTPIVERKIYQKAKDETLAERIALRPKKELSPIITSKPIEYHHPEHIKTETDHKRDIKSQGLEEKKNKPKKNPWVDTRKQKYSRRRKPVKRRKPSDGGWGDLIEKQPVKRSKHIRRKKIGGIDTIIATRRPKRKYRVAAVIEKETTIEEIPRKRSKKKGFGDTFFSAAEKGWKKIEERRAKRQAYKETEEYQQRQKEREERWEAGKKDLKEKSERFEHDVKEGTKRTYDRFENKKVVGPGYDRFGYPIKGYKPPKKKNPEETVVAGEYKENEE